MSRIMVVDDAQFMRMRVTKLLIEHGYEVIEAIRWGDGSANLSLGSIPMRC